MINLDDDKLKQVFSGFNIPPKPEILQQIQDITSQEEADLTLLANVVSQDIGLSSAILKTINSPYFGMNRVISDIKQAVMFLGLNKVETITTGILLRSSFAGKSSISLERFWDNATDVANAMLYIGNQVKDKVPLENLYTLGLFHDSGIAAMSIKYEDYKQTLIDANGSGSESLLAIEERKYRTNHAVVGYFIASSWHLPKSICQLILNHHEHQYLDQNNCDESNYSYAALKIAENMVDASRRYTNTYDWPFVKDKCLEMIGITEIDYKDFEEDFAELS